MKDNKGLSIDILKRITPPLHTVERFWLINFLSVDIFYGIVSMCVPSDTRES